MDKTTRRRFFRFKVLSFVCLLVLYGVAITDEAAHAKSEKVKNIQVSLLSKATKDGVPLFAGFLFVETEARDLLYPVVCRPPNVPVSALGDVPIGGNVPIRYTRGYVQLFSRFAFKEGSRGGSVIICNELVK